LGDHPQQRAAEHVAVAAAKHVGQARRPGPLEHRRDRAEGHQQGEQRREATRASARRDLDGEGLVLMPSAFNWPSVNVLLDPPWQPTLIYPARGVAALWQPPATTPPVALGRLIGRTRAKLLLALAEPASTGTLARRYSLSPGTVFEHLAALRDAGLVSASRARHRVLYERTPLGIALANIHTS